MLSFILHYLPVAHPQRFLSPRVKIKRQLRQDEHIESLIKTGTQEFGYPDRNVLLISRTLKQRP